MTTVNSLAAHAATSPLSNDDLSGALEDISHLEEEIKQLMQEMMVLLQRALSNSSDEGGPSAVGGAGAPQTRLAMPAGNDDVDAGGDGDVDDGSDVDGSGDVDDDSDVDDTDDDSDVDDTPDTSATSGTKGAGDDGSRGAAGLSGKASTRALSEDESRGMAKSLVKYFMDKLDIPQHAAEGMVASLYHESAGLNANISQGETDHFRGLDGAFHADDNRSGFGLGQWSGTRLEGLKALASKTGNDVGSPLNAAEFIVQEMKGPYSSTLSALRNTKSAQDATEVFTRMYEQPSDPQMASRLADLRFVQA
ncbi:phage tail tip lysozyme [Pandoraea sp. ISTKB]|uniref:phage tail tip lysozyme n=1 Tax=Pandoraea sp. ISTKB TaxID=1586708 RepID=UPI001112F432|nr:phage tail tip lysozyme [Pandoraea sp. ISTKB]